MRLLDCELPVPSRPISRTDSRISSIPLTPCSCPRLTSSIRPFWRATSRERQCSCRSSNDDIQVSCNEVDRVARGIDSPSSHVDFVHLRGVDHVLKADASLTGSRFTKSLAFSPQLKAAVRVFVTKYL